MAFLIDTVFDSGLSYLDTNGTRLDITVGEATNFLEATGVYNGTTQLSAGNDTVNTGAPEPGTPSGRMVTIPAITAGSVTATETVTHWALTGGASILLATGVLTAPQAVTNGNTFTLDAVTIALIDAISV